ncbi:TetR/AcrR family transcriptional regulator [Roseisolibacter sp. H3M3-2]|uniref:TetR/AcrR family transcriptional regulator n=1 Tax=Roseisolibacter sp. H3M3-2 TaxID=3031323 RepID=UPI0023DA401D|nr:TetR/AcrR family transcriptional regulator [Roseisolibacter sp. H3M3-2]MDF1503391.1 helix-turn-helix domain containing protein [Roseisolibacter sp. H3M3-2]
MWGAGSSAASCRPTASARSPPSASRRGSPRSRRGATDGAGAASATTRRIADEAGVNEVTLFRLFGSKDALLDAAVEAAASGAHPPPLPAEPREPERELSAWCAGELARLRGAGAVLRRCLAAPDLAGRHARTAERAVDESAEVLRAYVDRLAARTPLADAPERGAAVAMLVSTLATDALGRDGLPAVFAEPPAAAPRGYVRAFLRALGWPAAR